MTGDIQTDAEATNAASPHSPAMRFVGLPQRYQFIFTVAISSFKFLITWRRDLYRLLWPFVLAQAVGLWGAYLGSTPLSNERSQLLGNVCMIMAIVVLIPIAARVQRFVLDPKPVDRWELWQFGGDEGLLLWAALNQFMPIFFSFCFFGTIILIVDGGAQDFFAPKTLVLAVTLAITISVFLSRLLVLYPMTLAQGRPSVRKAWRFTKGHYIELLLILGFSTVPFRLVYRLSEMVNQHIWADPASIGIAESAIYLFGVLIPSIIASVGQIVMTLIAITLAYQHIATRKGLPH